MLTSHVFAMHSRLDELRWQKRVVIHHLDSTKELLDIERFIHVNQTEFDERKLIVFLLYDNRLIKSLPVIEISPSLSKQIEELAVSTKTFLIGLDGGIKHSYSTLDWLTIFSHIDGMPMRKVELRHQKRLEK